MARLMRELWEFDESRVILLLLSFALSVTPANSAFSWGILTLCEHRTSERQPANTAHAHITGLCMSQRPPSRPDTSHDRHHPMLQRVKNSAAALFTTTPPAGVR